VTVLPFSASGGNCDSAAIESLACGRPVIEGRQPGISPLVSDGKDGFLVDPGDVSGLAEKLLFLISHAERRREMGQFGRFKVEARYSWPRAVDRLEKVYAGVLSGRLPAAAQALPFA
ncbi:MAG TPA: glycosyltransferase family 4 protein, partial [Anaerolineales bacterium]